MLQEWQIGGLGQRVHADAEDIELENHGHGSSQKRPGGKKLIQGILVKSYKVIQNARDNLNNIVVLVIW